MSLAVTLTVGHTLNDFAHRSCIFFTETHRHGRGVEWRAGCEEWSRTIQLLGEFPDDRHVLLPDLHLHCCVGIVAFYHHRRTDLEHAGTSRSISNHLNYQFRIKP